MRQIWLRHLRTVTKKRVGERRLSTADVNVDEIFSSSLEPRKAGCKLAYLISQYPAVNHTFVLREIRQLRTLGYDVSVASIRCADRPTHSLTPEEHEEFRQTYYIQAAGVKRIVIDHALTFVKSPIRYIWALASALGELRFGIRTGVYRVGYFAEAVMIGCWMQRKRLGHVHTHFSSTVALLVSRIFPITFSATIHGPDEFRNPIRFQLPEKTQSALFVCAISEFGREQLKKCSPECEWEKIEVCRLGVNVSVFAPRTPRTASEPFEILCVARLAPAKAQHVLIAAVGRLVQAGRKLRVRFVGDGPDRRTLEEQAQQRGLQDHTMFEGSLNQKQVRDLYQQTDIFALSSFAEGVPVVLMEAMAMEIACVGTNVDGVPELIRNEVDGLLVPPGDEEALAAAIARLQDDPELRERLGKSARQRVLEEYNLEKNVEGLAGIFCTRLALKRPRT